MTSALLRISLLLAALGLCALGCSADAESDAESTSSAVSGSSAAQATTKLTHAIERKEATDARLGRALRRVGPMLTSDQNRAFLRAFTSLEDVDAVANEYQAAARALSVELTGILADDTVLAGVMRPPANGRAPAQFGPRALFDAHVLLAKTSYATTAVKLAVRLLAGDPKLAAMRAEPADVVEKLLVPALPGTYLEQLLAGGSTREAARRTKALLDQSGGTCREIAGWLETHQNIVTAGGEHAAVDRLTIAGRNVGTSLHAIAGLIAIWELGGDVARGDVDAALRTLVDRGTSTVSGLAEATSLVRRVLLGVEQTPFADNLVRWSGRIGGGIGAVSSLFQLAADLGKWDAGADAKVRVAGDLVALGAAVLMLVSTGPVGPALALLAAGLQLSADWLRDRAIAEQERADLAACLPRTGLSALLVERMTASDPAMVGRLAADVKLSPEHIQWLIGVDEWAVTQHPSALGLRYNGVLAAQDIFALDGAETHALLRAVIGTETRPIQMRYMVDTFMRSLETIPGWNGDLTKAAALAWLDRQPTSPIAPASGEVRTAWMAAFRNARAYLATR